MPTSKEKDIELEHKALTKENRRIRTTLFGIYLRAYAEPEITRFSKLLRELLKKDFDSQDKKCVHHATSSLTNSDAVLKRSRPCCGYHDDSFEDFGDEKP
jgi:hypothetical protein